MDRSLVSFIAGASLGIGITILLSFGIEDWDTNPTSLVLEITSMSSKIWLAFYYFQLVPMIVIGGLAPLRKRFKAKRFIPMSFSMGQATAMVAISFLSYAIHLFT